MSMDKCQDPAFNQLRDTVRAWFPEQSMKLADPKNPVRLKWLSDQGLRLDSSPYLSGAYETTDSWNTSQGHGH